MPTWILYKQSDQTLTDQCMARENNYYSRTDRENSVRVVGGVVLTIFFVITVFYRGPCEPPSKGSVQVFLRKRSVL